MDILIWILLSTQLTIFSVTLYLHRSQAHRAVDFHPALEHLFRFWIWFTTGTNTTEWTAIHRKHHAKCETPEDPHSPVHKGIWNILFQGWKYYRIEAKNEDTIQRYGRGTPTDWLEKNMYRKYTWVGILACLGLNLTMFGWLGVVSWGIQMLWIPFWAAGVINGLAHHVGYRNHECPDKSTNLIPWGIWIGGEELHNNHHGQAKSAKFSHRAWEFDIGWAAIVLLRSIGLAHVKYVAPKIQTINSQEQCTFATLEALIESRYAIMHQYTKKLKDHAGSLSEQTVQTIIQMKTKLEEIWTATRKTKEELLKELQAWCIEAEESGIKMLIELSHRIKGLNPSLAM